MKAQAKPLALVVARGLESGRRFLPGGAKVHIGRGAGNHVVLTEAGVSRRHAILSWTGSGWRLSDCGSSNGTTLNGLVLAAPSPVRDGDRIGLGPVVLLVAEEAPAAPATPSESAAPADAVARWWSDLSRRRRILALAAAPALAAAGLLLLLAVRSPAGNGRGREVGARRAIEGPRAERVAAAPVVDPEGAREAYERGRRKLEERRVAPRNLYDAWSDFTRARALLGAQGPRPAALADVDDRIAAIEVELRKDCARLLFAGARQARYDELEKAQRAWRELLQRFPADDPWGCRKRARGELRESQGAAADAP